jgi:hypothetical protein
MGAGRCAALAQPYRPSSHRHQQLGDRESQPRRVEPALREQNSGSVAEPRSYSDLAANARHATEAFGESCSRRASGDPGEWSSVSRGAGDAAPTQLHDI